MRRRNLVWVIAVAGVLLAVAVSHRFGVVAALRAADRPAEARSPEMSDAPRWAALAEPVAGYPSAAAAGDAALAASASASASAPTPTASGRVPPTLPVPGARWVTPSGYAMRYVPPGMFEMGEARTANAPVHRVFLSRGFWIGETDVPPAGPLSWCDAVALANELSARESLAPAYPGGCASGEPPAWDRGADGYRLPTEAEWEWAARARRTGAFWGERPSPHPYGLLETQSGRWEWVWDRFGAYPLTEVALDPVGPDRPSPLGDFRVARGRLPNVAFRAIWPDDLRDPLLGVRWVRPL